MDRGRYSLTDMLDRQPDSFADAKIKAMMSDIYDNMVGYVDNNNSTQVSDIISKYGVSHFIEWFINKVYLPNTTDVKVMSYVSENKDEIVDVLRQAMSTLTPKEVIENMDEEKVEGADEVSEENKSDEKAIQEMMDGENGQNLDTDQTNVLVQEPEPEPDQSESEYDKAKNFLKTLMGE